MRYQPTSIERLDSKHAGLRLDVDLWLERNSRGELTLEEIVAELKKKYRVNVPLSTLSNYKQQRWWPQKARMQELRERFQAINQELGDRAISESTQAMILEELDKAIRAGAGLNPHFLLKEQRLWAQHTARLEQIENEKRKLELEIERRARELKESLEQAKEKIRRGESVTVDDINRIRKRVFGLPPIAPGHPA